MRIVASGDWHLDAFTGGLSRYEDLAARVDEVIGEAEQSDMFLHLGDLSDPDTPGVHRAVQHMCECASNLASRGVPSSWIVGNHDVTEDGEQTSVLAALLGIERGGGLPGGLIKVYDRPSAEVKKLIVNPGLHEREQQLGFIALPYPTRSAPYDPREYIAALQAPPEGVPILVAGHLWLEGVEPASESTDMARGRSVYWPLEELKRFAGPGTVLVGGHYHRQGIFSGVHIAGSLERLTFDDGGHEPGFLILDWR